MKVDTITGNDLNELQRNIVENNKGQFNNIAVANNSLFADALSGAALATKNNSLMILTDKNNMDSSLAKTINNNIKINKFLIFGKEGAVSQNVDNMISNPSAVYTSESGNTTGNIINGGMVVENGGYTYLSDKTGIYKEDNSTGAKTKICDDQALYMNIANNCIYYRNESDNGKFYKVNLDGSNKTKINDDYPQYMNIEGQWAYYRNMPYPQKDNSSGLGLPQGFELPKVDDEGLVVRVKLDGTSRSVIIGDKGSRYLNVVSGYIYYVNNKYQLFRSNEDGTSPQQISDVWMDKPIIEGTEVYYINIKDNSSLYKMSLDGTNNSLIKNGVPTGFNVKDGTIYYQNVADGNKLYQIKTDGTSDVKLTDGSSNSIRIGVSGDSIYYVNGDSLSEVKKK